MIEKTNGGDLEKNGADGKATKENAEVKLVEVNHESKNSTTELIQNETDVVAELLLNNLGQILESIEVEKIYFIDDAIDIDVDDKTKFIGIVREAINTGKGDLLKEINIKNAIDFNIDPEVLPDHINEKWDDINRGKRSKYYKKVFTIIGQPEAIKDLDESSQIKNFFKEGFLECLTPVQWDDKKEKILESISNGNRIMILFDQDLRLAGGRFEDDVVTGEKLILELKDANVLNKVVVGLLTHTITTCEEELPMRSTICERVAALNPDDFFVLAKNRLEEHRIFADGIKKTCLNIFCEAIKTSTISILKQAQINTIEKITQFDTYDFDHTVFQSSFTEGVWEPETLLRITDVIFRDEVRDLMINTNYVPNVNGKICKAREISSVKFDIDDSNQTYREKLKLRHQEMYENEKFLNQLRRPIENGDIFSITDGEKKGKKFILVAQECDLMVRTNSTKSGKRGARTASLLEIETLTNESITNQVSSWYSAQIAKKKFGNHFYADKFKLEYFESGTTKVGLVNFTKSITVDLNVLDLIVFNETGEAVLDFNDPTFDERFHNYAWIERYGLIKSEFEADLKKLEIINTFLKGSRISEKALCELLEKHGEKVTFDDAGRDQHNLDEELTIKLNRLFGFISKVGIMANYSSYKFNFGLKRTARLRMPLSRHLLDRYTQHLSRFAELHDFVD